MSAYPEIVTTYECGCKIHRNFDGIKWVKCPLHEHALELSAQCEQLVDAFSRANDYAVALGVNAISRILGHIKENKQ